MLRHRRSPIFSPNTVGESFDLSPSSLINGYRENRLWILLRRLGPPFASSSAVNLLHVGPTSLQPSGHFYEGAWPLPKEVETDSSNSSSSYHNEGWWWFNWTKPLNASTLMIKQPPAVEFVVTLNSCFCLADTGAYFIVPTVSARVTYSQLASFDR
jgi:hypothetical protein